MAATHILAIDQGTTSSRAILFDDKGMPVVTAQREFKQYYPADGWVEHDPEEIWFTVLASCKEVLAHPAGATCIGIGITNQRETTLLWDRKTHEVLGRAIVWQDRRTAALCAQLKAEDHESMVTAKTGLLLDPYFSATKLGWLLDNIPEARHRAERGELAFGTIDSFILWRLTGGKVHATDATNASRTLLYNIHKDQWDDALLQLFRIPSSVLPEVKDSADDFGMSDPTVLGKALPIAGIAGDQQAATIGQCCFASGACKSTYGTGAFLVMNTGAKALVSKNRLLTTICYRLNGKITYALEGSIFVAGAAVQWLRDGLKIIRTAAETEALARSLHNNRGVYLVPAFTGLGAPYWEPDARGAIFGLTRDTGVAELVRAALESVAYQTQDLLEAMQEDGIAPASLRIDGGMIRNDFVAQMLADILGVPVDRPIVTETTAVGAASLAALSLGCVTSLSDLEQRWQRDCHFTPELKPKEREDLLVGWRNAVRRVRSRL
ncbi:MAG: glycerol kinase GlpK [Alphaproteobacteria bacterium]